MAETKMCPSTMKFEGHSVPCDKPAGHPGDHTNDDGGSLFEWSSMAAFVERVTTTIDAKSPDVIGVDSPRPRTVTVTEHDERALGAQYCARRSQTHLVSDARFPCDMCLSAARDFLASLPDAPPSGEPYCWLVTHNNGIRFVVFTQEETARYSQAYTIRPLYAERDGRDTARPAPKTPLNPLPPLTVTEWGGTGSHGVVSTFEKRDDPERDGRAGW